MVQLLQTKTKETTEWESNLLDYTELAEEQLVTDIQTIYNSGVGAKHIHDLTRRLYLEDNDLAKQIYHELEYWLNEKKYTS